MRDVRFTPANDGLRREGLLGWVACTIGHLRVDGLVIRRTAEGRIAVFMPERTDKLGRLHKVISIPDAVERDSTTRLLLAVLRARASIKGCNS